MTPSQIRELNSRLREASDALFVFSAIQSGVIVGDHDNAEERLLVALERLERPR